MNMEIVEALRLIDSFSTDSLRDRIAELESKFSSKRLPEVADLLRAENINTNTVTAAFQIKRSAAQISVVIHTVGILVSLPHILEAGEFVESLSLGAGNTGRDFDPITNTRVAEFKFIEWQGGSEAIRQNNAFYDFFALAEHNSNRNRFLYLLGTNDALRFLRGNRSLKSVLSKNQTVRDRFLTRYSDTYKVVSDYYNAKQSRVNIIDLRQLIPSMWSGGI